MGRTSTCSPLVRSSEISGEHYFNAMYTRTPIRLTPWRPDDDADSPRSKSRPCRYVRQPSPPQSHILRPLSPQKLGPTRVLDRRQILWTVHGRNEFPVRSIENPVMLDAAVHGPSTSKVFLICPFRPCFTVVFTHRSTVQQIEALSHTYSTHTHTTFLCFLFKKKELCVCG